jgi:aerobic-type carbon monoxide dehydrogenase small subunit (CoxS/CutS family)
VHRAGVAVRSCQLKISTLQGADIKTIEGLSPDGTHALQKAWEQLDVPQCGYCQAGQIMSAASLLDKNPNPSDSDIDAAMNGNICRCATYIRIREGIKLAAQIKRGGTTIPAQGRAPGSPEAGSGQLTSDGLGSTDGAPKSLFNTSR